MVVSPRQGYDHHDPASPIEQAHRAVQPPKGEQLSLFTPTDTGSEIDRMHREYHNGAVTLDSEQWLHGTQASNAASIMRNGLQSNPGAYGPGGYLTRRVDTAHQFSGWNGGFEDHRTILRGTVEAANPVHLSTQQFEQIGQKALEKRWVKAEPGMTPRSAANEFLRSRGHDAVFLKAQFGSHDEPWAITLHPSVFKPAQAMSVEAAKNYFGPGHPEVHGGADKGRTDHFVHGTTEHFQPALPGLATAQELQEHERRQADEAHRKRQEEMSKLDFI